MHNYASMIAHKENILYYKCSAFNMFTFIPINIYVEIVETNTED